MRLWVARGGLGMGAGCGRIVRWNPTLRLPTGAGGGVVASPQLLNILNESTYCGMLTGI
jgi:hypothetical protein